MSQQQTVLRVQTNIPHATISGTTEFTTLDLYSDIPIKINKSIAEVEDIGKKNSDLSIGLLLPGSKKNNQFFESFFNVDATSLYFNATERVNIDVLLNDQSYFKGYMRLNKVSVMNSKVEYDVTLYSSVGDLFGKIGNNLLQDLDFNDSEYTFNHTFSLSAVTNTFALSNFFRDSKYPYTYFYPIVHNGYNYIDVSGTTQPDFSGLTVSRRTSLYTPTSPISGWTNLSGATAAGVQEYRINSPLYGLYDNQLKPALNIYSLIQLIFKTYGYEISSTFFNTPWFKTLYLYGYFSSDSTKFGYKLNNIESLPLEGIEIIFSGTSSSTGNAIVTKKGTGVPCFSLSNINVQMVWLFPTPFVQNVTIPSGLSGATINKSGFTFSPLSSVSFDTDFTGDETLLKYFPTAVGSSIAFFDGDPVDFNLVIDQNIKQIDLLSSIAKKFNLIFYPDPNNSNKIVVEPFDFYMGTGTVHDWTPKLSYDKGFTVEPALNFIESTLELTDQEDGDEGNREFKIRNNRIYGRNISYNPTDFKSQDKKIETIFSPELVRQWDNDNIIGLPLGINYAASSQQSTFDNQIRWIYNGVKSKPKLFFWLMGLNPFIDSVGEVFPYRSVNTYSVRVMDFSGNTGSADRKDRIPSISHTMPMGLADQYKINNDSLSILFNSEETLENSINLYNTYTDNDVYNKFYNNRITNLYDPNTRYLSGYFDLKYSDVQNFNWNDIIKINEQHFIVNKINEFNLTNRELTKVDLIQYNVNSQEYPERYFAYYYCEVPDVCYKLKTNFTNENLLNTNFIWSLYYDNQVGSLTGQTSGFTSAFRIFNTGTTQVEYFPYTMYEITKEDYETSTCDEFYSDNTMDYIYDNPNGLQYSIPSFWDAGGILSGFTGVNVWNNCTDFYTTALLYGINIGSVIPPQVGLLYAYNGTTLSGYTSNLNYISTGYTAPTIPYSTPPGGSRLFAVNKNGNMLISDGSITVGSFTYGQAYFSRNYGRSWLRVEPSIDNQNVNAVCVNDTGQYMGAAFGGGPSFGIRISRDFGVTWTHYGFGTQHGIKCSNDGRYWLCIANSGSEIGYRVSQDYGYTWTYTAQLRIWSSIAMSTSGQYMYMATLSGSNLIAKSSDYGSTFTITPFSDHFKEISCSDDGSIVYISVRSIGLSTLKFFKSTNYGNTYSEIFGNGWIQNMQVSSNGQYILANQYEDGGRNLVLSSNYGESFTTLIDAPTNQNFLSLALRKP